MGRRFVSERRKDPYYREAQRQGLRSRAAFKLEYLAQRYPIFHEGDRVLDLGAAPGGWSLFARQLLGDSGEVVAVDPRHVDPIPGVEYVAGKVGEPRLTERLQGRRFDVVLSDMSPRISGAYATDHARSVALVQEAAKLCRGVLEEGGTFVAKVFAGDLLDSLVGDLDDQFGRVVRTKPPASREHSSEIYFLCFDHRSQRSPRTP